MNQQRDTKVDVGREKDLYNMRLMRGKIRRDNGTYDGDTITLAVCMHNSVVCTKSWLSILILRDTLLDI
jgi:hypothetical protein